MSIWDRMGIGTGSVVLNIGYGTPNDLAALSEMVGAHGVVYGIERDEALIHDVYERLANHPMVRVMVGDARNIPLSGKSVDFALLKGLLHEVENVSVALAEARRVLRDNGRVMIVDFAAFPSSQLMWSNLKWRLSGWKVLVSPPDKHPGFAEKDLSIRLEDAGLVMESYEDNVAPGRFGGHSIPLFLAVVGEKTSSIVQNRRKREGGAQRVFPL